MCTLHVCLSNRRDLLEKLSRLLKVKQKFSLRPDGDCIGLPLVRRLECDLSHEKLLTLYVIRRNLYETEEIIGFHSLTNDKNSNLEFSSQFSYVIASGVQISFSWLFVQGKSMVECRVEFLLSAKRLEIMWHFYWSLCSKKGLHAANHGILLLLIL